MAAQEAEDQELVEPAKRPARVELAPIRVRRSLALRVVALVTLVLFSSGLVAFAVVDQMRSLRARFDLLTGVYVPFQERLAAARVQSAKISAVVAAGDETRVLRSGDLLNLSEALQTRTRLVKRSRQPLEQGVEYQDRIGGEAYIEELEGLLGMVRELEALVAVDEAMDPADVLADVVRQDEIGRAFRRLEDSARRAVRSQRDAVRAAARDTERFTLLVTLSLGIAALLATLFVIITLRPLRRLPQIVRRLGRGEWGERIEVHAKPERDDEVARLSREFNRMARDLEERERELIRGERLAAIGQMAAQITHEIRNPLSSVALSAELLEDELEPEAAEARRLLARISGEVDRLTEITETYLRFSRRPAPSRAPFDLSALAEELLDFLAVKHRAASLVVEREIEAEVWVRGDAGQLRQALMNLVRNAAEAAAENAPDTEGVRGHLRVELGCKQDLAVLVVRDDGPGIDLPEDVRERIFEAFYTRKAQGTGLGLPMVQQIVSDHEGRVFVRETGPQGTVFELQLPSCDPPGASVSSPGSELA